MPVYEFRCSTCHAVFDERRPMAEADAPATLPGRPRRGAAAAPCLRHRRAWRPSRPAGPVRRTGGGRVRQRLRLLLSAPT